MVLKEIIEQRLKYPISSQKDEWFDQIMSDGSNGEKYIVVPNSTLTGSKAKALSENYFIK